MYGPLEKILERYDALEDARREVKLVAEKKLAQAKKSLHAVAVVKHEYDRLKEQEILAEIKGLKRQREQHEDASRRAFQRRESPGEYIRAAKHVDEMIKDKEKQLDNLRNLEYLARLTSTYFERQDVVAKAEARVVECREARTEANRDFEKAKDDARRGVLDKTRNILRHYLFGDRKDKTDDLLRQAKITYSREKILLSASDEDATIVVYVQVEFTWNRRKIVATLDSEVASLLSLYIDGEMVYSELSEVFSPKVME